MRIILGLREPPPVHPERGLAGPQEGWLLERRHQLADQIVDSLGRAAPLPGQRPPSQGPSQGQGLLLWPGVSCSHKAPAWSQAPPEEEATHPGLLPPGMHELSTPEDP